MRIINEICKFISKFILLPFIILLLLYFLKIPPLIIEWLISFWMAIVYAMLLSIIFNYGLSKKINFRGSLYKWMDELNDRDEELTLKFKSKKPRYKTIDNLLEIKNDFLTATESSLEKLRLYKAFYVLSLKESTEELYYKIMIGFITSLGVVIIRYKLPELDEAELPNTVFIGLIIIFSILAFVSAINNNKKRTGLIIELLGVCIEEIEEKVKRENEK